MMNVYQSIFYFITQKLIRYFSHAINLLIVIVVKPDNISKRQNEKLDALYENKNKLANKIYDYNKKHEVLCFSCEDICCAKCEGDRHEPVDCLLDKRIRSDKELLSKKNSEWYQIKIKRNLENAGPCPYLDPQKGCKLEKYDRPILCPQWFCVEFYKVWNFTEVVRIFRYTIESTLIRCSVLWIAVLSSVGKRKFEK